MDVIDAYPRGRPPVTGLVITGLIVFAVTGGSALSNIAEWGASWAERLGYATGAAAVVSLIAWLALWFGFVKKSGHEVGGRYYLVLFAAGLAGALLPMLALSAAADRSEEEWLAFNDVTRGIVGQVEPAIRGEATIDRRPTLTGRMAGAEALTRNFYADLVNEARAYQKTEAEIAADQALSLAALARPGGIAEARRRLDRLEALNQEFRTRFKARIDQMRVAFQRTPDLSNGEREAVAAGFDSGVSAAMVRLQAAWAAADATIPKARAQLDVLERSRGRWQISGDQLRFERQADLEEFNALANEIDRLNREAEARREALRQLPPPPR